MSLCKLRPFRCCTMPMSLLTAMPAKIKDALVRQLYSPVRWVETVLAFGKQGITHNVECAPGKVLAGLNKRIDTNQQAMAINDGEALKAALAALA